MNSIPTNEIITSSITKAQNYSRCLIVLLFILGICFFTTVRGWTNICFSLVVLVSMTSLVCSKSKLTKTNHFLDLNKHYYLFFSLAFPIFAVLVTQSIRNDFLIRTYDAPSRMLFAIPVILYLATKKINFTSIIGYCAPICLILTAIVVHTHPEYYAKWAGRYSTKFVDPDSLGDISVVLSSFCLFSLYSPLKSSKSWLALQFIGIIFGLYTVIGTSTRGSWLAIPFILLFWISTYRNKINKNHLIIAPIAVITLSILIYWFAPNIIVRLASIYSETNNWLNHTSLDTSAGIRLTMYKMSWTLFQHQPWAGYGDFGYTKLLDQPWLAASSTKVAKDYMACCGPHNELIANLLRSGVFGGVSYLLILFSPMYFFMKHLSDKNENSRLACQLGIVYLLTLIICGLSLEVLTLKYTVTFYSMLISGLIGQILFNLKE